MDLPIQFGSYTAEAVVDARILELTQALEANCREAQARLDEVVYAASCVQFGLQQRLAAAQQELEQSTQSAKASREERDQAVAQVDALREEADKSAQSAAALLRDLEKARAEAQAHLDVAVSARAAEAAAKQALSNAKNTATSSEREHDLGAALENARQIAAANDLARKAAEHRERMATSQLESAEKKLARELKCRVASRGKENVDIQTRQNARSRTELEDERSLSSAMKSRVEALSLEREVLDADLRATRAGLESLASAQRALKEDYKALTKDYMVAILNRPEADALRHYIEANLRVMGAIAERQDAAAVGRCAQDWLNKFTNSKELDSYVKRYMDKQEHLMRIKAQVALFEEGVTPFTHKEFNALLRSAYSPA